jgi:tRNA G18 (ribose-2'-O)-methylase SpoU
MEVIHITNLENSELEPYLTLRRPEEHWKRGIFIAEGEKVVIRLLKSSIIINSLLLTPEWYNSLLSDSWKEISFSENQFASRLSDAKIYLAEKEIMEKIVGFQLHQGIMALASVPPEPAIEDVLKTMQQDAIIVALDGLVNAENVGVIVRNCAAFGAELIIVGEKSSSPYLRRAVRNSMGALFQIPVIHTDNLQNTLRILSKQHSIRIIAAYLQEKASLFNRELPGTICIVFGNEDKGISKNVLEVCDEKIAIPMMKETDSLNVASASAVFLYEARKQRTLLKSRN